MINQDKEILTQLSDLGLDIIRIDNREAVARCPLHQDNNPSFFFNLDTYLYHCFAECLKGRGISQLEYQLTGKVTKFSDIISLPSLVKKSFTPRIPVLPLAIDNEGEKYLTGRGFTRDTIKNWNLMYWDEPNGIIIPIEKVGYILRYITPEDLRKKYKNIAGTKIQTTLFGIEKFESNGSNSAIIVEGSLDVIYMHQLGYKNVLGLLHSDISDEQLKILRGICNCVKILIDNDAGGANILNRIVPCLRKFFIVKILQLPKDKDPNDCSFSEISSTLGNDYV